MTKKAIKETYIKRDRALGEALPATTDFKSTTYDTQRDNPPAMTRPGSGDASTLPSRGFPT